MHDLSTAATVPTKIKTTQNTACRRICPGLLCRPVAGRRAKDNPRQEKFNSESASGRILRSFLFFRATLAPLRSQDFFPINFGYSGMEVFQFRE